MNLELKEDYQIKRQGNIIVLNEVNRNFTAISNEIINDSRLELKEKGLLLHILSKPDGWILNVDEISSKNRDGKKSIYAGMKKLKELGYITLKPKKDERGKITRWDYIINLKPSENIINLESHPLADFVQVEKLQVENRSYSNTNYSKTNKEVSKKEEERKTENEILDKPTDLEKIEIDNVEETFINFADKKEENEIRSALDNLIEPLEIIPTDLKLKELKLNAYKIRKVKPMETILTQIKQLPEFYKQSKLKNPDKEFKGKNALNYLDIILSKPSGDYPEWFKSYQDSAKTTSNFNAKAMEKNFEGVYTSLGFHSSRFEKMEITCLNRILDSIENFEFKKENKNLFEQAKKVIKEFGTCEKRNDYLDYVFNEYLVKIPPMHSIFRSLESFGDNLQEQKLNIIAKIESFEV